VLAFRTLHLLPEVLLGHLQLPLAARTSDDLSHGPPPSKKSDCAIAIVSWRASVFYEIPQNLQATTGARPQRLLLPARSTVDAGISLLASRYFIFAPILAAAPTASSDKPAWRTGDTVVESH
jgi:hypothetical protein